MKKRSFWMYCACEILFSPDFKQEPIKGRILKLEAIRKAEEHGLRVNQSMTGAAWAFTYLTKHFGFAKRVSIGVYILTAKGSKYRNDHTKDDFYKALRSKEIVRSKDWHTENDKKPPQKSEEITVHLNGHKLSGNLASIGKIVQLVTAK